MNLTVSDFQRMYSRSAMLIAGRGGLSRTITSVGILDYELLPEMRDTYLHTNAGAEGSLMLTTFLYAKENPHLITEAVRSLVATGVSGLVIKNVFRLKIPDAAVRLAEARDFPIFVLAAEDVFVDTIIVEVNRRIDRLRVDADLMADLEKIARRPQPTTEVRGLARELLPSMAERNVALFASTGDPIGADAFEHVERAWRTSGLSRPGSLLARWRDGIEIVYTQDPSLQLDPADVLEAFWRDIAPAYEGLDETVGELAVGASAVHDELSELGMALCESYEASRIAHDRHQRDARFDELGILGAILPSLRGYAADEPPMVSWAHALLRPMWDHDDETGGHLSETLSAYVTHGGSIPQTARALGQHENTVRYRLTRIGELTKTSWHEPEGREQLFLACRTAQCWRALRS